MRGRAGYEQTESGWNRDAASVVRVSRHLRAAASKRDGIEMCG